MHSIQLIISVISLLYMSKFPSQPKTKCKILIFDILFKVDHIIRIGAKIYSWEINVFQLIFLKVHLYGWNHNKSFSIFGNFGSRWFLYSFFSKLKIRMNTFVQVSIFKHPCHCEFSSKSFVFLVQLNVKFRDRGW